MLVFDYRYNAVRKKTAEYNTVAPEMYATVIEDESIRTVDDIQFVTSYRIRRFSDTDKAIGIALLDAELTPFIDYSYSQLDLKLSSISFDEMVAEFMKANNVTEYSPCRTTVRMSKKLIEEYMDDEEE